MHLYCCSLLAWVYVSHSWKCRDGFFPLLGGRFKIQGLKVKRSRRVDFFADFFGEGDLAYLTGDFSREAC
jgi:hypothetical protein